MKPTFFPGVLFLCLALIATCPAAGYSEMDSDIPIMTTTTTYAYRTGAADTPEIARALALYGAKQKAVAWAAGQLDQKGLLKPYGARQMAIFCLVADALHFSTLDEMITDGGTVYTISIKCDLSVVDFVRAEIVNAGLDREELQFDLKAEMEPQLGSALYPARELSRVYRYLGRRNWRKAIILLDHLERKYPHWDAIFLAKSLGFRGLNEAGKAQQALGTACRLGNREACATMGGTPPTD